MIIVFVLLQRDKCFIFKEFLMEQYCNLLEFQELHQLFIELYTIVKTEFCDTFAPW